MKIWRTGADTSVLKVFAGFLLALIFSLLFAVTIGSSDIPFKDVYHVVFYKLFGIGDAAMGEGKIHDVVCLIRWPGWVWAAAIGMGLSICGVVRQAIVKTPLPEPYLLVFPPELLWVQRFPLCWVLE